MDALKRRRGNGHMNYNELADDIFGPMRSVFGEMIDEYSNNQPLKVTVKEEDESYILRAEVPGLRDEDITLSFDENILSLKAEWQEEREDQLRSGIYQWSGRFRDIDVDKTQARLENGILRIDLPKSEKSKPRRIEIKK